MKTSFSALIKFPKEYYYPFMAKMDGIATFNSIAISNDGDGYDADLSFPSGQLAEAINSIMNASGTIARLVPTEGSAVKATAAVRTYVKTRRRKIKQRTVTGGKKMGQLSALLTGWKTVSQISEATGWKSSTIHARFTGLRKKNALKTKAGPDGINQYRLLKKAA
jgi:hypothetical protein